MINPECLGKFPHPFGEILRDHRETNSDTELKSPLNSLIPSPWDPDFEDFYEGYIGLNKEPSQTHPE